MNNAKIDCHVAKCVHVSVYRKELRVLPKDKIYIYPSNPDNIVSAPYVEMMGKNMEEIIEHSVSSDDFHPYTSISASCAELSSKEDVLAIWEKDGKSYLFRFQLKDGWRYHTTKPYHCEYEATALELITNKTVFRMIGLENLSYDSIMDAHKNYPAYFIRLN